MKSSWNKGLKKETNESVAKTSQTMRDRKIDNFKRWRQEQRKSEKIKTEYLPFVENGDLAELIGVVLGDGHIYAHFRCESLRIVGNANSLGFAERYSNIVVSVFGKKPAVAHRSAEKAINITIYEKHISERLGIPTGNRATHDYVLPSWIECDLYVVQRFLRGLYEAEGSLSHHQNTYTHKFISNNKNQYLLDIVFNQVSRLGFHPHASRWAIQISKKDEVQKLVNLLQFRHYSS